VRLTPFYKVADIRKQIDALIKQLNDTHCVALHGKRGPDAKCKSPSAFPFLLDDLIRFVYFLFF
jgi:hypothetical protein